MLHGVSMFPYPGVRHGMSAGGASNSNTIHHAPLARAKRCNAPFLAPHRPIATRIVNFFFPPGHSSGGHETGDESRRRRGEQERDPGSPIVPGRILRITNSYLFY